MQSYFVTDNDKTGTKNDRVKSSRLPMTCIRQDNMKLYHECTEMLATLNTTDNNVTENSRCRMRATDATSAQSRQ